MAGIGFELKRLFKERSLFYDIRAYFISSLVSVGPTFLCILLITTMQHFMKVMGESYKSVEYFVTIIVYCFSFSLIITGGFSLLISRYVSDCIYEGNKEKIVPSLYGILSIVLCIDFIISNLFYINSNISSYVKIFSIILLGELSMVWIQAVYISALKDYMAILNSFLIGIGNIIISYFVLNYFIKSSIFYSALFSITFGFFIMIILFIKKIIEEYGQSAFNYKECFEVITSFNKYPYIFITGFLYYIGMYAHNFVFWFSSKGITIENTFRVAPFYDIALFYAFLSLMPIIVLFQVRTETTFYPKYKKYYVVSQEKGNIEDINLARSEMISTLYSELNYLIEMQFIVGLVFMVFGKKFLPEIGLAGLPTDIFSILVLGSMSFSIMYIIVVILLYFDGVMNAMKISIIFFVLNFLLTLITLFLNECFYGFGFFIAALSSLIYSYRKLNLFLKEIDYYTFASQPMFIKKVDGFFVRLYHDKIMKGDKLSEKD
ncbi:exopolysaccharide Pel transporter PelG [Clostridium sp. LCP25S3_F10]|uniref:exopolysaccharide Pel transporter PelG n=1 Tax=Clostridium sp. LCP25S3_F10 TaxID=3438750 RepID=UPI003F93B2C0